MLELSGNKIRIPMTEHPKNLKQIYDSMQYGREQMQPASQNFMLDPTCCINTNTRPPDFSRLDVKPALNYSIQTGEVFAFEFMRDRVNIKKSYIPNAAGGHPSTGYMDLKGILGINHTGSESRSNISMLTVAEKDSKELARRNTFLYGNRSNLGCSSGHVSTRGYVHGHASSGSIDASLSNIKILCSFGGRILPRPCDGKLRYVGGETHIMRINKNITWSHFKQKMLTVFNQTHIIKYQLPGEDLDALVSVSCDEDLQNMMEECHILNDGEGSSKLRMFLCSTSDLDDAYFSLGSLDCDSDLQYVVSVNGMDAGSRKSSQQSFTSFSANNVTEFDGQSIKKQTGRVATDLVGTSPSTDQYFHPPPSGPSNAYETHSSQLHHSQTMHHAEATQFHYDDNSLPPNFSAPGESSISMPLYDNLTKGHLVNDLNIEGPEMLVQKLKLKSGVQEESHTEKFGPFRNEPVAPSLPYDSQVMQYIPQEETLIAVSVHENERKPQENMETYSSLDTINTVQVPTSKEDDHYDTSSSGLAQGYADSESDPTDLSYFEPPALPQRVFNSERIPREQSEFLIRLSKSDDSLGSQLLLSHSPPDCSQQHPILESTEKWDNENLLSQTQQSIPTAERLQEEPQTIDDGLEHLQKYKVFADSINQKNSNLSKDVSGLELKEKNPKVVCNKDALSEDLIQKRNCETISVEDIKDIFVDEETEDAKSKALVVSEATSINPPEVSGSHLDEVMGKELNKNIEHAQALAWAGCSTTDAAQGEILNTKQGDILIDINDRFPRDFLSDIFSKAGFVEDSSGTSLLHKNGDLSMNMESREPQHWSFFQKLAQDEFVHKDVSLIDQDHVGFSAHAKIEEGSPVSYRAALLMGNLDFSEVGKKKKVFPSEYNASEVKGSDITRFDGMPNNLRTPDSEYEDASFKNNGLPLTDPSLGDRDISTLQLIRNDDLEELKELGSGTFGTVYHGKWRGTDVAIKRIKKCCFTGRPSEQERLTIEFWREADILSKLHHPNVLAFYGVVQDEKGETLATVTEFMVNGSLRHVLLRRDWYLDQKKRLIIAMDAAFGMEYLHLKNIVHFDLKCDNLLVNLKDPLRPICKVGDFGLSKIKRNTLVSGGVRGTLPWMAPELLNGSSNKVSEKVDVFSFGIVLWEILTGEEPYANMHYGAIIGGIVSNTLRPTIPNSCDPEWRRLMEQCWAPNPVARPSFTEIASRLREMSAAASHSKASTHMASK